MVGEKRDKGKGRVDKVPEDTLGSGESGEVEPVVPQGKQIEIPGEEIDLGRREVDRSERDEVGEGRQSSRSETRIIHGNAGRMFHVKRPPSLKFNNLELDNYKTLLKTTRGTMGWFLEEEEFQF